MFRQISLSSWSLHGLLGSGRLDLRDLPAEAVAHGIPVLELCHFHISAKEATDLASLRAAFDRAGAVLFSLLLDFADIAAPDPAARDTDIVQLQQWINIASDLGARRVRVIAGKQPPTPDALDRSIDALARLSRHAAACGVAVSTENFHATALAPVHLLDILHRCHEPLGLCVDFGNAPADRPRKYQVLNDLMPHAVSIHCKPDFDAAGDIDHDDLARCLRLADGHGFHGPISLINTHRDDEWSRLDALREAVLHVAESPR